MTPYLMILLSLLALLSLSTIWLLVRTIRADRPPQTGTDWRAEQLEWRHVGIS